MDATRIAKAMILPIAFGLPFGDELTERFMSALERADVGDRLLPGASVHASDPQAVAKLRRYAAAGARIVKLHPAGARFFPDAEEMFPIYRTCAELGLPVIFHGGRAGIEPEYAHQFTLIRHYEGALRAFPEVQFVLGHAGARDVEDAIALASRYPNVWFGIHGQGVTMLGRLLEEIGPERLLFGSDWPFYHLAATLAKVLLVTEGKPEDRHAVLRGNANRLLGIS
jgi:predicted TIM-barrel fold metal-dependent hydrolase